jgi:hypothetical protein
MAASPTTGDSTSTLPRVAGGFRLVRELGRGGMGIVYQAEELSSGRAVALKVLAANTEVSEEAFERFRRESRMAASISDSHSVFVYGAHQVDGRPAIAMELCPGETLEHRISKKNPIPVEVAVRWTLEILDGLAAASRAGVVHRDVKPSNCFITADGGVKVGDFGLSRSLDTDIRLTVSGAFLGSPLYASPEQVRGREVDQRSDIYSCGATLYALLAGRAPYLGANIGEVLARILSESPPPISSLRSGVPPELEKVVQRAMDREPGRRFPDHESFRAALEPFVAEEAPPAGRVLRAVSYVLDQMLSGFLGAGIMLLATALGWSSLEMDPSEPGRLRSTFATLLNASVPLLYFGVGEGFFGATLARWMLGQRVVDARTRRPNLLRALPRVLLWFGPGLLLLAWMRGLHLSQQALGLRSFAFAAVLYLLFASSMRRRNGYRGLHELASGTRVVKARSLFARSQAARPVPVRTPSARADLPADLGPYRVEGTMGATPSGTLLSGADANLNRPVWIVEHRDAQRAASDDRRSLARPGRLRWLDAIRSGDTLFEVFEAPGGASLAECAALGVRFDWPLSQRILSALAVELAAWPPSARVSLDQIWIDRAWNPRVLDEPIGADASPAKPPLELLGDAARLVVTDRAALPLSAEPVVRKLLGSGGGYATVEEASRELVALARGPMRLSSPARAVQIAISALLPATGCAVISLSMFALAKPLDRFMGGVRCIRQLQAQDATPPPAERMDAEDREAREIVIADAAKDSWSASFSARLEPAQLEIRRRAVEAHPSPSADEVRRAQERIRERSFRDEKEEKVGIETVRWTLIPIITAWTVAGWGVLCTLFAVLLRGGLSFRLFGMGLRDASGERASRLRCAGRSLAVWLPLVVPYGLGAWLAMRGSVGLGLAIFVAGALIHALAVGYAILRPSRGLQDRVAGTWLVSR